MPWDTQYFLFLFMEGIHINQRVFLPANMRHKAVHVKNMDFLD